MAQDFGAVEATKVVEPIATNRIPSTTDLLLNIFGAGIGLSFAHLLTTRARDKAQV